MKKTLLITLAFVVSLWLPGVGMAANHPNLVGTWSGTVHFVISNSSSGFSYADFVFTYEIQDEDLATGNFYGVDDSGPYPFTGNVATNKIVTIIERFGTPGEFRIFSGKVTGKKISGTVQHFHPDQIDTGTFTLSRE